MPISAQTVYVHGAALIDRTEMQNNAPFAYIGLCPVAPVPEVLVRGESAPYAGQLGLGGEGDKYFPIPFVRLLFAGGGESIVPQSVEVYKRAAPHLRTRIFAENVVFIERFAPSGKHGISSKSVYSM